MNDNWVRIPTPISDEQDRRTLCAILCGAGLEVRIVKVKETKRGTPKRYIEYRSTSMAELQEAVEVP